MIERKVKKNDTNISVAPKEKKFLSPKEEFKIIFEYTKTHEKYIEKGKLITEIECLKILFPKIFRPMYEGDLILGRFDPLAIGFGSVTSVGGPGHYCKFNELSNLKNQLGNTYETMFDFLESYWKKNDTREIFYKKELYGDILGRFVDVNYPAIITARFSGLYLDYNLLLDNGIEGLKTIILSHQKNNYNSNNEYHSMILALNLLQEVIEHHILEVQTLKNKGTHYVVLEAALKEIKYNKPTTLLAAMQLSWLYSSVAGVVNFGRIDDYLGDYLVNDLQNGIIDEDTAIEYIKSLWRLIEVKRTNVNGRVIVGGLGRRNMKNADFFCKLAIEATRQAKLVEPQFTLRIYTGMDEEIFDAALKCIGEGTTYPILYNDDINIPTCQKLMNVSYEEAEQYVPFGCGEFVLSTMGVGSPNACINLLKTLDILLHDGIDQWDYKYKFGELSITPMPEIASFNQFFEEYKKLVTYYIELTGRAHANSYKVLNDNVGFIFTSILTNDCITRGKLVLDGGVRYLGGTNEMYGNISTSDSLYAIKKLVFEEKKFSLCELATILANDYEGYEDARNQLLEVDKFGNDFEAVDEMSIQLHEFVCTTVYNYSKEIGLDSWLVVIINNQVNTEWGRATASSADGRIAGQYMSNANNPSSGCDLNGPTAMMNSLLKNSASIHGGSVQNIKFSKILFNSELEKIKILFKSYFLAGGPQLMITIVNPDDLKNAIVQPELYQNLIVRVGGFSARFVNLDSDVQLEILNRTLNE